MDGWNTLGQVLGGGIDRTTAYESGRRLAAQTEDALARARKTRLENIAAERQQQAILDMEDTLARNGVSPEQAGLTAGFAQAGGGNAETLAGSLLDVQEFGLRGRASAPGATIGERNAALAGVASGPVDPFQTVGPAGYANIFADQPTVETTPLGETMLDENEASAEASRALAALRTEQMQNPDRFKSGGAVGPGGMKAPPSGYVLNPDYDDTQPIGDGNYPYVDARQPRMGSRERAMFNRVIGSASATAKDLANLGSMPFQTTDTGFLGIGQAAGPDVSVLDAVAGNMKYTVAPQSVRQYNVMLGGLNRALALIEGQGLAASNTIAASYDSLALRPQDTIEDVMFKMAQTRQTVEQGLVPHVNAPEVSRELKDQIQYILNLLETSVPFTVEDVVALQNPQNEGKTIRELANQRRGVDPAASAAPTAPAAAGTPAAIEPGFRDVDDEGNEWEYGGGDPNDPNNWYPVAK